MRLLHLVFALSSYACTNWALPSSPIPTASSIKTYEVQDRLASKITGVPIVVRDKKKHNSDNGLPTISQESSSSYSFSVSVPEPTNSDYANPFIETPKLPRDLVFIIVGAIIGFIICVLIFCRIVTYLISNQRAKSERELYFHNQNAGFFNSKLGMSSSGSSMLEKSSASSTASTYIMSRQSSVLNLMDTQYQNSSKQGRSYRESNRGSMFISPVQEIMKMGGSNSQLELPLYNKPSNTMSSTSLLLNSNDQSSSSPDNFIQNETGKTHNSQRGHESNNSQLKRPPSQFLNDLIYTED